jgi:hypothetical protein
MSYATSEALQVAIYTALIGSVEITTAVGGNIFDALPAGALPSLYIALGEEKARDHSTKTASGALHDIEVNVHGEVAGIQAVKALAALVCDALIDSDLVLNRGVLTRLQFKFARARKGLSPDQRVINLTFRACVVDV